MVKYSCKKCGKKFSQKSHYIAHKNRKTPCENNTDEIKSLINDIFQEKYNNFHSNIDLLMDNSKNNKDEMKLLINETIQEKFKEFQSNVDLLIDNKIKENIHNPNKLNAIDLFCGCGGMSKGLTEAGINVVAGIDVWDVAIESYKKNFNHIALCKDLEKFPPEDCDKLIDTSIDIIAGGPPCQGFSMAGKRDKKDPRNSLFMEFYKYLKYFKPKIFIMENVMGILSMKTLDGVKVIDIIMKKLNKKYNCCINKLYASDFEVPQIRRRVIIIGIRKDLNKIPNEIEPILKKSERIGVGTILEKKEDVDKKFYLSKKALDGIKAKKEKMKAKGHGFGAQFLSLDKPSYTIPARYWKDGYDALVKYNDNEIRRLTILELKRIQSFPDNYILIGNRKNMIMQIGNAVACRFAYHLGKYVIHILQ